MTQQETAEGEAAPREHGPESVCYSLAPGGGYQPFLQCLCGWSVQDYAWEDLGRSFDEHLAQQPGEQEG